MADDPDAIWRPGFTGEVVYPARVAAPDDGPAHHRRPSRRTVVIAASVLVAVIGGVSVATWPGSRDAVDASGLPTLPDAPVPTWTAELPGVGEVVVEGVAGQLIVAANDREQYLIGLEPATGDHRWRADLPVGRVDELAVFDDVVVVSMAAADGTPAELLGVDARRGEHRWSRLLESGAWPTVQLGEVMVFRPVRQDGGDERLERWDPATGEVIASVDAERVSVSRTSVQARRDGRLEIHDPTTLALVAGVDLGPLGLTDAADVTAVVTDAGPVVATASGVMLLDATGAPASTVALDGSPADSASVSLDVLDAEGRLVALQHGDELTVLEIADARLRELWDDSALLLDWHVVEDRALVATITVTGSVLSGRPQIVDAETGDAIDGGRAVVQFASPFRTFAADGFIDVSQRPGAAQVVVGYDLERSERWRFSVDERSDVQLIDGGVLEVDRTRNPGTRITLHA